MLAVCGRSKMWTKIKFMVTRKVLRFYFKQQQVACSSDSEFFCYNFRLILLASRSKANSDYSTYSKHLHNNLWLQKVRVRSSIYNLNRYAICYIIIVYTWRSHSEIVHSRYVKTNCQFYIIWTTQICLTNELVIGAKIKHSFVMYTEKMFMGRLKFRLHENEGNSNSILKRC